MVEAAELAGFVAAHSIWCVRDGETLIPLVAYETPDGDRTMKRLESESMEESVERGKAWMAANPDHAVRAVLVFDGYLTLETDKLDALIVTIRDYTLGDAEITMAVPYRPAGDAEGFAVYRPKFLGFGGSEPDWQTVGDALWRGIEGHPQGFETWNKHVDESK
jgi:hypothetical protein